MNYRPERTQAQSPRIYFLFFTQTLLLELLNIIIVGTGSYSTYADPIARRGIAVSLHKPVAQPHHPLHPARRIRNLHERSAIISHYNSHYRQRQYHPQPLHPEPATHRVQAPPMYPRHSSHSSTADSSEVYIPVPCPTTYLHDPTFIYQSQSVFSPPHQVDHYPYGSAAQLPVAPPYPGRFSIPQAPLLERPFRDEMTAYNQSPFTQRFEGYENSAYLLDSCALVTENESQISEVDMFDRECINSNSDETLSSLSKQTALPYRECIGPPKQLLVQHWDMDDDKEAFDFEGFAFRHHKEQSHKRGIDRFRNPCQRDNAFAVLDTKKQGLNLPRQHRCHPNNQMPTDTQNDIYPFEKPFHHEFNPLFEDESAKMSQLTQNRGIDRFSTRQQKQKDNDNVISDDFRRPKENAAEPFSNRANMPLSQARDEQNEFGSFHFETHNDQKCSQFADPTQWNPIASHQSESGDVFKPVRFFNEGVEVDIENLLLSRPGSSVREKYTEHF